MPFTLPTVRPLPVYTCDSSLVVGEYVCIGVDNKLIKAKADSRDTMPCIGFVTQKLDTTHCRISGTGPVILTGAVNKKPYFISVTEAGRLQDTLPPSNSFLQMVAEGIGDNLINNSINPSGVIKRS